MAGNDTLGPDLIEAGMEWSHSFKRSCALGMGKYNDGMKATQESVINIAFKVGCQDHEAGEIFYTL